MFPVLALLLCACGRINFDPLGGSSAGDGATDSTGPRVDSPAVVCTAVPSCPTGSVGTSSSGGTLMQGRTAFSDVGLSGSCGGSPGAEATFTLNAFDTGHYTIKLTTPGAFVIYARDQCCTGPELGCTADPMTGLTLALVGGQSVIVIGDGAQGGQSLTFVINGAP